MSAIMEIDAAALAQAKELLERESMYLDEQRWDEWLALFTEDCEYWMPAWKADGTPTSNPQAELSHIYYASRAGLEERILRIRSRRSPASTPMPRTAHLLSAILPLAPSEAERQRVRATWTTHVFLPRNNETQVFFGRSEYELLRRDAAWRIARKKILMQNDYIPTLLDVYCV